MNDENQALIAGLEKGKQDCMALADCDDCPIAFECSYVRRGLKPGDLLGFDTDDDD
jgi:hypothetical protein